MKKIIIFLILITVVSTPGILAAQGRGVGSQVHTMEATNEEDPETPVSDTDDNQNQLRQRVKTLNPRSEIAREHMSIVTQTVEELLTADEVTGGIGQQVREIARQQKEAQEETEIELEEIDSRPGWLTRLVGPNHKALKNINQQIEKNQLRIRQLEQLMTQAQNQADQTQLQETVEALNQQNTSLQERVQAEEGVKGLFGWLTRLFSR